MEALGFTEKADVEALPLPQRELLHWLRKNSPTDLYHKLTDKVLGQDEEVRKAAILVYSFLKSMAAGDSGTKFHFLIEGKSGCGKTTFANALREVLPCPVVTADASQLTPAGFKGAEAADFVTSAELEKWWGCGVIVLDELDKVMEPIASSSSDNFHRQGLENLLKMLDGGSVMTQKGEPVSCERMLFIGMGAFSTLQGDRKVQKNPIGFAAEPMEEIRDISKETMSDFCGSEQLMGRFVTVLHFKPLSREMYNRIVARSVREISRLHGCFHFTVEDQDRIVDQAMSSEFGCRSIKSAVWELFLNLDTVISKTNLDLIIGVGNATI